MTLSKVGMRTLGCAGLAVALVGLTTACSSSGSSSSGDEGSTVDIGVIAPLTGAISASFAGFEDGARARIDMANAAGGPHKFKLIVGDDQSSSQGALTAAQSLASQGVVGIAVAAPSTFDGAAQAYVSGRNIPFVSPAIQTEAELKDPNNYSITGVSGTASPATDSLAEFMKSQDVKSVAVVGWGAVEASVALVEAPITGFNAAGIKTVLQDLSSTPTTSDYTSVALAVKKSGAQAVFTAMTIGSQASLAEALKQQAVPLKAFVNYPVVFEPSAISGPSAQVFEGSYFLTSVAPQSVESEGTTMYAKTGVADGLLEKKGFIEADLLIQAVDSIHGTVDASALTKAIRRITAYNADGMLADTLNFSSMARAEDANVQRCNWYVKVANGKFDVLNQKPTCGAIISGN